jgi:hypothetical protein
MAAKKSSEDQKNERTFLDVPGKPPTIGALIKKAVARKELAIADIIIAVHKTRPEVKPKAVRAEVHQLYRKTNEIVAAGWSGKGPLYKLADK